MLDGDLLTSPVEQVLLDLGAQGATGCLYVTSRAEEEAEVYLRDGLVYAVFVPGRRPLLGVPADVLRRARPRGARRGAGDPAHRAAGLAAGRAAGPPRATSTATWSSPSSSSTSSTCSSTCWAGRWPHLELPQEQEDPPGRRPAAGRTRPARAPARPRAPTWERLTREIGGPDAVPVLATAGAADSDVVLGPGEWAMLCKVDGERSVADLAADCGFTVFEAGHIIAALAKAGLVDMDTFEDAEDSGDSRARRGSDDQVDDGHDDPRESDVRDSVDAVTAALRDMFRDEEPEAKAAPSKADPSRRPRRRPRRSRSSSRQRRPRPRTGEGPKSTDQASPPRSLPSPPISPARSSDCVPSARRLRLQRRPPRMKPPGSTAEIAARQAQAEEEDRQRRVAEKDRRRREADTVAKAMEEARQRDLDKVSEARRAEEAAERKVQEALERVEAEADAWADHRTWLDAERGRQEPAAWADHRRG